MRAGLVDSHCHLDRHVYPGGPDEVLARARAAGVETFVAIGVGPTLETAREVIALAESIPDVFATVGVHPHDARHCDDAMVQEAAELAARPEVVAVGEIGLDYHYMSSERGVQRAVFAQMIGVAKRAKKPIVVHTREAPEETIEILDAEGARDVGGIIHCFSEDLAFAKKALDLGFDLSFSGIVTFKNARAIQEVAAWAPADRILVETDSPYLAPVPFRGKPCEPAMTVHTARRIAELRGVPFEEVRRVTTENAVRRLGLA